MLRPDPFKNNPEFRIVGHLIESEYYPTTVYIVKNVLDKNDCTIYWKRGEDGGGRRE